jgi:hypothetical protein
MDHYQLMGLFAYTFGRDFLDGYKLIMCFHVLTIYVHPTAQVTSLPTLLVTKCLQGAAAGRGGRHL